MVKNVAFRVANPFGGLGGSKSVSGSNGSGFARFKALFKRTKTPDRPKVTTGRLEGEMLMKRTGKRSAVLHLGRLVAAPPKPPIAPQSQTQTSAPQSVMQQQQVDKSAPQPKEESPLTVEPKKDVLTEMGEKVSKVRVLSQTAQTAVREARDSRPAKTDNDQMVLTAWAEKESKATALQNDALAKIETTIAKVDEEIAKAGGDPQIIAGLIAIKRQLIELAVATSYPRIAQDASPLLPKDGLLAALQKLEQDWPGEGGENFGKLGATLENAIDILNSGRSTIPQKKGEPANIARFREFVGNTREKLERARHRLVDAGLDAKEADELMGPALRELEKLEKAIEAREPFTLMIDHLVAAVKDYGPLQAKFGEPKPAPFPLGATLRAMAAWPPGLGSDIGSDDPKVRFRAAESMEVMSALLIEGQTPALLLGPEASFDKAALIFATRWAVSLAEKKAIADYKALHPEWDETTAEPQELTQARTKAAERARALAKFRQELTTTNRKLEKLLKTDRRIWNQPSTWRDKGLVFGEGAAISVAKDSSFMRALVARGGKEAGRDVILLLARISDLESRILRGEQQVLGLHEHIVIAPPGVDVSPARWNAFQGFLIEQQANGPITEQTIDAFPDEWRAYARSFPPEIRTRFNDVRLKPFASPDPDHPLAHIGVTDKDLEAMGLDRVAVKDLEDRVVAISKQGIASVEDAEKALSAIVAVVDKVLNSELGQETIGEYGSQSVYALGRRLLNDILTDALVLGGRIETGETPELDKDYGVDPNDPKVIAEFKRKNALAKQLIDGVGVSAYDELGEGAKAYTDLEMDIVALMGDHKDAEKEIERARDYLRDQTEPPPDGLGLSLDPDEPKGLTSAKTILEALQVYDQLQNKPGDPDLEATLEASLEKLRGFDQTRMHRPWTAKIAAKLGKKERPSIEELERLRNVAEAIVTVRETGPAKLSDIKTRIEEVGVKLDEILANRAQRHSEVMDHVRQLTRAALLSVWPRDARDIVVKDGRLAPGFDPSTPENRKKIIKQLEDWGLDSEKFLPEIDAVLFGTIGKTDLATWREEAIFSEQGREYLSAHPERPLVVKALDSIVGHQEMDEPTKRTLLSLLDTLQEGDKINLKSGQKISLDTGKIPIEPTGLVGLKAKLSGSRLGQFEIEMGSDGYKLHLRVGNEGRLGGELVVGNPLNGTGDNVSLKLEAAVGVDGSHAKLNGVTISFAKSDAGREALLALVAKMSDREHITMLDLTEAVDIATKSQETTTKVGVTARAGAKIEFVGQDSHKKVEKQGVGIGAEITGSITKTYKDTEVSSLNGSMLKGEVDTTFSIGGSVGVYARLYNAVNTATGNMSKSDGAQEGATKALGETHGKPNYDISSGVGNVDLLGVGGSLTGSCTLKWKVLLNSEGQIAKGEKTRHVNVKSGPIKAMASVIAPSLQDRIDNPEKGSKDETLSRDVGLLMGAMQDDDFLVATYTLKDECVAQVNAMLLKAKALRREGSDLQARKLLEQAEKIIDDENSYIPSKISLVTTTIDKRENVLINARFIQFGQFSDGKMEHPAIVLSVPPPPES